jgi:predicted ATPase
LPTAALFERILSGQLGHQLLLVGTYRSDEVTLDHDLHRFARATRAAGSRTTDIRLLPLTVSDLQSWISDAVSMEPDAVSALAEVVLRKTGGAPLAVARFLSTLVEEELVAYSEASGTWTADIAAAQDLAFTENLLSVMLAAMSDLPVSAQPRWSELTKAVNAALQRPEVSGVIVSHGTDTLEDGLAPIKPDTATPLS